LIAQSVGIVVEAVGDAPNQLSGLGRGPVKFLGCPFCRAGKSSHEVGAVVHLIVEETLDLMTDR
jgi:hypothetical protein